MNAEFPKHGVHWKDLERELWEAKRDDPPWRRGTDYHYWPETGDNLHLVAKEAANLVNHRLLGRKGTPSALKVEREVKRMVLEILNGPDGAATTLTAGGTESNYHAVKVARDWAREHKSDVSEPEIVVPYTAHPSFDKAAQILDVKVVRVPQRSDFRADVDALAAAITPNTIMLVGSAPSFPHGVIDPISDIAALAERSGVWCHVDSCVGGFLIPFLRKLGQDLTPFDFEVPGVRSISADLHKFGLAPTGISTFSLRDEADLQYQRFSFDNWPYGQYVTETFAGSRSASSVAGAWAVMKHLGEDGYLERARRVLRFIDRLTAGIEAIDGLRLLAPPEVGILLYTSDDFDIVAVADGLNEIDYPARWNREPPAIHLLISPLEDETVGDDYLEALRRVVAGVKAGTITRQSTEAVYA